MQQKIVITGGPGTGKSTIINELIRLQYDCMPEISREIIRKAKTKGIEQLFLKDPVLFSKMLLEGRKEQFLTADKLKTDIIFFDRGIPDIPGYMDYLGVESPGYFWEYSKMNRYDKIFLLPPWEEIYNSANERYESFEQSVAIHSCLKKTYLELDYKVIDVPEFKLKERVNFILKCTA